MRRICLAMILSCLIFQACGSINNVMSSWEGENFSNLVAIWGPPQQVMDDGNGGRIFIYINSRRWTSPGRQETVVNGSYGYGNINAYAVTTSTPPQQYGYDAYRMFWINQDGTIYRWAWKGL